MSHAVGGISNAAYSQNISGEADAYFLDITGNYTRYFNDITVRVLRCLSVMKEQDVQSHVEQIAVLKGNFNDAVQSRGFKELRESAATRGFDISLVIPDNKTPSKCVHIEIRSSQPAMA